MNSFSGSWNILKSPARVFWDLSFSEAEHNFRWFKSQHLGAGFGCFWSIEVTPNADQRVGGFSIWFVWNWDLSPKWPISWKKNASSIKFWGAPLDFQTKPCMVCFFLGWQALVSLGEPDSICRKEPRCLSELVWAWRWVSAHSQNPSNPSKCLPLDMFQLHPITSHRITSHRLEMEDVFLHD